MKYTKGKWVAKGLHILCEGKTGSIGQAFIMNISHDLTGKGIPDTEGEANAKLFAAAPELLKWCKYLRESILENDSEFNQPELNELLNQFEHEKVLK